MTVLIAIDQLPASVLVEAREACKTLDLLASDWVTGMPRVAPLALIGGLEYGARRVPDELMALLEAMPGVQLVLCSQEPLVKPRVVIGDGRICVLGPPLARAQIVSALRAAILPPAIPVDSQVKHRFEVLRRSHWIAWTRGTAGPQISLHEQAGATVVIGGAAHDQAAIADVMTSARGDAERESELEALAGTAGVAHLTPDASEWVMYWPIARCPLWLYSPNRIPARWNAARGIAEVANRRLLRLPAFPADQLVAAWSEAPLESDTLGPVEQLAAEGGSETIIGLDSIAAHNAHVTGLVMEVR